jgi:hypothetical protein
LWDFLWPTGCLGKPAWTWAPFQALRWVLTPHISTFLPGSCIWSRMNRHGALQVVTTASFLMLVRPRLIAPPSGELWNATPGSHTRSNQHSKMAGMPYHVGKHSNKTSAARTFRATPRPRLLHHILGRAHWKRLAGDVAVHPNSSQKKAAPFDQSPRTCFQNATMSSRNSVASPSRLPSLAPFLPYPAFSE